MSLLYSLPRKMRLLGMMALGMTRGGVVFAQAQVPAPRPVLKVSREEEDWRFLQDSIRRTDWLDPLKYLPLRPERPADWFLSAGGEVRLTYEHYRNDNWGSAPSDDNGYLLQRGMLHADAHLGPHVRVFGQLMSGLEHGRTGGPRPAIDENCLDLHQGFVDLTLPLGGADDRTNWHGGELIRTESAGGIPHVPVAEDRRPALILRAGRQELHYGSTRLVSLSEGPNLRRSFDAVRLLVRVADWRVDGFVSRPVQNKLRFFDDRRNPEQAFWGVYATLPVRPLPTGTTLDGYYLGLDRPMRYDQGRDQERRHTVGARLARRGGSPFEYDVEVMGQFGQFGRANIRAYSTQGVVFYTFSRILLKPRLFQGGAWASGDRSGSTADLQTFSPLYPDGALYGLVAQNGASNLVHTQTGLSVQPVRASSLTANCHLYWRHSRQDGLYNTPGFLVRPGNQSTARHIGTQADVVATWQFGPHVTVRGFYTHYFAGRFLRETPPGRDIDYFALMAFYRF